jgi:hypothetical protein
MTAATFDLDAYRRERNVRLERENEYLRAELERALRLLSLALEVAVGRDSAATPGGLLEVLCALVGTNPARAAFLENRERRESELANERLVELLRETA